MMPVGGYHCIVVFEIRNHPELLMVTDVCQGVTLRPEGRDPLSGLRSDIAAEEGVQERGDWRKVLHRK